MGVSLVPRPTPFFVLRFAHRRTKNGVDLGTRLGGCGIGPNQHCLVRREPAWPETDAGEGGQLVTVW